MLLKSLLLQALPTSVASKFSHELTFAIDYLFFRFTTATSNTKRETQTPGNKLQNIRFAFRSSRQKTAFFLIEVFLPYFFYRLVDLV